MERVRAGVSVNTFSIKRVFDQTCFRSSAVDPINERLYLNKLYCNKNTNVFERFAICNV